MMIYRPTYRGTDGKLRHASKYWVKYYVDRKMVRRPLGVRDKRAAEQRANEIVRRDEMRAVGVVDPFERHRKTVLSAHLAEFDMTLKAAGVVERYRKARREMLDAFTRFAGAATVDDLDPAAANRWLAGLRERGLGSRSVNIRYQALRQLGRWLVRTRRHSHDPFESLTPLNEQADRRHVRRALSPDEVARLLDAARARPVEAARAERIHAGVSAEQEQLLRARGEARRLLYLTAVLTGLRRGELSRVRWCDVDLEGDRIRVPAASAKSRRDQTVEIPPDLHAALLSVRPAEARSLARVFPANAFPQTRTFWADLRAAGIERVDAEGVHVDFHSLRVTFVTWLVRAGVNPKTAQMLARHASIETTMQVYTDPRLLDFKGAVGALPRLGGGTVESVGGGVAVSDAAAAASGGGGERATAAS